MTSVPDTAVPAPRRGLPRAVRIVLSVALLGWLVSRVSWADITHTARAVRVAPLLVGVGAIVAGQLLRAARTCSLVRGGVRVADLAPMLRMQMLAFLPGMLSPAKAGELLKVELLRREWGVSLARGTGAFLVERVADVLLLGACALWGLVAIFSAAIPRMAYVVGAVMLAGAALAWWAWRSGRAPREAADRLRAAAADVRWGAFLGTTLAYWALVVGIVWLFARSAGATVSYPTMAGAVPLSLLSALLPVSIGGFGVRESAMVLLFQHDAVGCTAPQALTVALLYDVLGLGVPAAMGIAYLLGGARHG